MSYAIASNPSTPPATLAALAADVDGPTSLRTACSGQA